MDPGVDMVVQSIINPSGHKTRLAADGQGLPTSLVDLHLVQNFVVASTFAGTYPLIPAGTLPMYFFRSPLRSIVMLTPNVPRFLYNAAFVSNGSIVTTLAVPAGITSLVPLYFTATVAPPYGGKPHGSQLFCGSTQEFSGYFWVDPGTLIDITRDITTAADTVTLYQADFDGVDPVVATNALSIGTGSTYFTSSTGAYYRLSYTCGIATGTTIRVDFQTTGPTDVMAHLSLPRMIEHIPQLTSMRVNACNLLISNAATELQKGGFIMAANISETTPWWKLIGVATFSDITNDEKFFFDKPFKTGMYTYLAPSKLEDLSFENLSTYDDNNKVPISLAFPLMRDRYTAVSMQVNRDINNTYQGMTFVLNSTYILEFLTNDPWYDVSVPSMFPDQVSRAIALVGRMDYFFENPTHLQNLARMLRGGNVFLRKHMTKIGGALSVLFPQWAPAIGAVSSALAS
jgi:hypothetical protein